MRSWKLTFLRCDGGVSFAQQGISPDVFEESVAQALFDLEATSAELKGDLRDLYIISAKEVDVSGGRKAIIIYSTAGEIERGPIHLPLRHVVGDCVQDAGGRQICRCIPQH